MHITTTEVFGNGAVPVVRLFLTEPSAPANGG
jgi:hypothetical protein